MTETELFLAADADLRSVIDRLTPADLARPAPQEWRRTPNPTLRDIVAGHAYDEAWVPEIIAGRSLAEGERFVESEILGDDPIGTYDGFHDAATAAVRAGFPDDAVAHFSYGDYPLAEGLTHLAMYRGFQAWLIAKLVGLDFRMSPEDMAGMNQYVVPVADEWRTFGVLPPAIEPPAGADEETVLLCAVGFWHP